MNPILNPCDVGRKVTLHFGRADFRPADTDVELGRPTPAPEGNLSRRRPVTGVLQVVRWVRDQSEHPQVLFDLQVDREGVLHFDLADSEISHITIGRESRVVGPSGLVASSGVRRR